MPDAAQINDLLQQGIAAAKAGRKEEARRLLTQLVDIDEHNEKAWLWLSGVVESAEDRQICLENVLALNPDNRHAQAGLEWLRQHAPPPPAAPAEIPEPPAPAEAWEPTEAQAETWEPPTAPAEAWQPPAAAPAEVWEPTEAQAETWEPPAAPAEVWDPTEARAETRESPTAPAEAWEPEADDPAALMEVARHQMEKIGRAHD